MDIGHILDLVLAGGLTLGAAAVMVLLTVGRGSALAARSAREQAHRVGLVDEETAEGGDAA